MTGPRFWPSAGTRTAALVLIVCLLAVFWSCAARPRPEAVPEPAPRPVEDAPAEPEVKPETEVRAEIKPATDETPAGMDLVKTMSVPSVRTWTDTGLDVEPGEEYLIKGTGGISLQRGNPTAFCGPDGYDLRTAQQPLLDKNIGALVGRVVQLLSIETDPETKKEFRHELIEVFFIGAESRVLIPIRGRLFLGINENVAGDNSGEFKASVFRPKKSAA